MPPYCRGSKHQKNGLAPLEERKRLCDPPNLPNLISFICLFPINMQPLALFLRKEPGGLSSSSGLPPAALLIPPFEVKKKAPPSGRRGQLLFQFPDSLLHPLPVALQDGFQKTPRVGSLHPDDLLRCSFGDDGAAGISPFRAEVDNVI